MLDARSGAPIAALYVDLFPREGKYNHAAVWSFRNGSQRLKRAPQAALVVNVDRNGLTLDDLETLLHEFGHAVHNNLSATRHVSQAGTSVLRDFVEAPSQMLEPWIYDPRVLALMQEVCAACAAGARCIAGPGRGGPAPRQGHVIRAPVAVRGVRSGDARPRRTRADGAVGAHGRRHRCSATCRAACSRPASRTWPRGYGAGYYGYLWSEVVAADLRTAFAKDRLDPAVGQRYRRTILANGSQIKPDELVRRFLGRDSDARAFFAELQRGAN